MRILSVVSTTNFAQFTRRATLEGIARKSDKMDLLFFIGLKQLQTEKISTPGIKFHTYYFWVPGKLKKYTLLGNFEYLLRGFRWKNIFKQYDVIFFTDPNQAYLLPYCGRQKIVYLIRDPNVLQSRKHINNERKLIEKAHLVLATSLNLAREYIPCYYGFKHPNTKYWANCADLKVWNWNKINIPKESGSSKPLVGMAGNINKNTDIDLLDYITKYRPDYKFQLCGNIFVSGSRLNKLSEILGRDNVEHLGLIKFDELPSLVAEWNVGITVEAINEYTYFTHHNKVYQYLALGKPVVVYKIHNDYDHLHPHVLTPPTYKKYADALDKALESSKQEQFNNECIEKALENSSDKRAEDFLKWVKELMTD